MQHLLIAMRTEPLTLDGCSRDDRVLNAAIRLPTRLRRHVEPNAALRGDPYRVNPIARVPAMTPFSDATRCQPASATRVVADSYRAAVALTMARATEPRLLGR
jgi:hypothetical protein